MGEDRFGNWYERNKEAYNEARRRRYQTDPKYREQVKRQMRKYRAKRRTTGRPDRNVVVIDGVQRRVRLIGEVAAELGRAPATIRLWERSGLIPTPTAPGQRRAYTDVQVSLMCGLRDTLIKYNKPIKTGAARKAVEGAVAYINEHWRD